MVKVIIDGIEQKIIDYEVQTGILAEPSIAPKGNGHIVEIYNSALDRTIIWFRGNSEWKGVELL